MLRSLKSARLSFAADPSDNLGVGVAELLAGAGGYGSGDIDTDGYGGLRSVEHSAS